MMLWISVKERLPETQEDVLVNDYEYGPTVAYHDGVRWIPEFKHAEDITHWMPLPDPPPGDETEGE